MPKVRIDKLLFEKGLAPSRERAQSLILSGNVLVNEVPVTKSGHLVSEDAVIRIKGEDHPYVGRGGVKLAHALKEFNIDPKDKVCVDVGASTGGFTDCLLQNGAKKVYAIDVGYGQLAWKLQKDERVVVMDRTNIREISESLNLPKFDLAVIDVSFISLSKVFPSVDKLIKKDAVVISLIKPQFEVGRENIGKGGIVKNDEARNASVENILSFAESLGWQRVGLTKSPITGADGNIEFLACFVK